MNGLSCGEESMTICSAVLIQYQRVTDRRTDGRTDGRTSSLYLLRASALLTHVKMKLILTQDHSPEVIAVCLARDGMNFVAIIIMLRSAAGAVRHLGSLSVAFGRAVLFV